MLVLSLLENENMYGYQMIRKLSEKSQNVFEFQEGTLYPILHSLEEKNYITSYWDNTGAKKRKYYSITKEGKKHLQEKKSEWKTFELRSKSSCRRCFIWILNIFWIKFAMR